MNLKNSTLYAMIGGYFVYKWVVNKNYEGEDDCVLRD